MKQQALSNFDLPWLPITGLVIFVLCFAIYIYFTYRKANKPFYQKASLIPLDDPKLASVKAENV